AHCNQQPGACERGVKAQTGGKVIQVGPPCIAPRIDSSDKNASNPSTLNLPQLMLPPPPHSPLRPTPPTPFHWRLSQVLVAESLGSASVGALVALVSIWNFLGRMAAGYVSEQCLKRWCTPRPLCMLLVQAAMGCAHLLFSIGDPLFLYPAAALVGAAHGAHWTLMVTTASELFGLKHFGALYNTLSISSTVGSYCLSVKLAGYIYDRQSAIQRSAFLHLQGLSSASPSLSPPSITAIANWGTEAAATAGQVGVTTEAQLVVEESQLPHRCMGPDCFRLTFLVMALVCVAGICALLNLVARTRRLYQEFHKVQRS
ncbi:unnamed protein product, partial [Closterium sp. NIES-53]